jgi:hypothetical protein
MDGVVYVLVMLFVSNSGAESSARWTFPTYDKCENARPGAIVAHDKLYADKRTEQKLVSAKCQREKKPA